MRCAMDWWLSTISRPPRNHLRKQNRGRKKRGGYDHVAQKVARRFEFDPATVVRQLSSQKYQGRIFVGLENKVGFGKKPSLEVRFTRQTVNKPHSFLGVTTEGDACRLT